MSMRYIRGLTFLFWVPFHKTKARSMTRPPIPLIGTFPNYFSLQTTNRGFTDHSLRSSDLHRETETWGHPEIGTPLISAARQIIVLQGWNAAGHCILTSWCSVTTQTCQVVILTSTCNFVSQHLPYTPSFWACRTQD